MAKLDRSEQLICMWFIVLVSNITYAVCGLGNGLMIHGLYHAFAAVGLLPDSVHTPFMYICIVSPAIQFMQFYNLWMAPGAKNELNKHLTITFSASMLLGLVHGLWFLASVSESSAPLRILLVLAMAATVATKLGEAKRQHRFRSCTDLAIPGVLITVVLCGFAAGFCQGVVGVGGAAKMIMIIVLELSQQEWRSTACVADILVQITRFTLLVVYGHIDLARRAIEMCALLVAVAIGLGIGNHLAPLLSGKNFLSVVMVLVCGSMLHLGGSLLSMLTLQQIQLLAMATVTAGLVFSLGLLLALTVAVRGNVGTVLRSAWWYHEWVKEKNLLSIQQPFYISVFSLVTKWR